MQAKEPIREPLRQVLPEQIETAMSDQAFVGRLKPWHVAEASLYARFGNCDTPRAA